MDDFPQEKRNQVRRLPKRGQYDRETIYRIVDEALVCHIGFAEGELPFVIPTLHARIGDTLYCHGAPAGRLIRHVAAGHPVCAAFTLLDGLVFARAAFHHSVNYRSAVLFGTGRLVESDEERLAVLAAITEHLAPGRWAEVRPPNRAELAATAVIAIAIESASAKIRTGPPSDADEDDALPVWAGVLPLGLRALSPVNDPKLRGGIEAPDYIVRRADGALEP